MAASPLEPTKIEINSEMLTDLFQALNVPEETLAVFQNGGTFALPNLEKKSSEFQSVKNMFNAHLKKDPKFNFTVESISKVLNPFLFAEYSLKMRKKKELFNKCNQSTVFHGTSSSALIPICQYNFDWRKVHSHRYGRGSYFTKSVSYASHYGIEDHSDIRIMIIANVIITGKSKGERGMILPPDEESDTSVDKNEVVLVKYEDADVCPAYVVYYRKMNESESPGEGLGSTRVAQTTYLFDPIPSVEDDDPNIVVINP